MQEGKQLTVEQQEEAEVARLARFQDELLVIQQAMYMMSKTGLTEMATFKKPPKNVEDCMAGVLILLGEEDLTWLNASNRMREGGFIARLLQFNYDDVPLGLFRRLERHINKNPDAFVFETVMKQSVVCASFVKWVMFSYKFYLMQYPEKDEGGLNNMAKTKASLMSRTKQGSQKQVQPEDNWDLTANPTKYLDVLPQPYRFINNCLDLLILRPVFNQITLIEEQKKTTEYEGFLKEVQATGFVDASDGITCISQVKACVIGAGGKIDKEASQSVSNKVIIGDKFGTIQLFDAGRKLMLDKKALFEGSHPRQILNISSASVVWVDTKLTYLTVVARASPVIRILAFKHNENKLYHLYNLNVCPSLANPDNLDANPDQSYLDLPSEAKLSPDNAFLVVTSFNGEVKLFRMPAIINPTRESDDPVAANPASLQPPAPAGKGQAAPAQAPVVQNTSSNEEKLPTLRPELDSIQLQTLDMASILISKIEAKKDNRFKDPYVYNPNADSENPDTTQVSLEEKPIVIPSQMPLPNFKYALGAPTKDTDNGDAGLLCKRGRYYPNINFIRSKYCTSASTPSTGGTSDSAPSSRQVKEYFITTGIVVAYLNSFDVQIFNIQRPSKDNVMPDYSIDNFNKIIGQKKLQQKKKPGEKTLTQLIKTVRSKEGDQSAKAQEQEMQNMRESMGKAARNFKMPYTISAVAHQNSEDLFQGLALGLQDGAIIVLDLVLGIEKWFLEKHPGEISTMAFWEDRVLISGSVDGRINVQEMEPPMGDDGVVLQQPPRILKCQNCQDRKIPVAQVIVSDFGIGASVDIEGNCRFYDMVRIRKICKVSSLNQRESEARFVQNKCKWRLLPSVTFEVTGESFLGVTQTLDVASENSNVCSEKEVFIEKKYSDVREHLKSLNQIAFEQAETPFYHQKSTLTIFRFEDVVFSLYPHMAQIRKKGQVNFKDIFLKNDPANKEQKEATPQNVGAATAFMNMQSGGDRFQNMEVASQKSGMHMDLGSLKKGAGEQTLKSIMSSTGGQGRGSSTVNFNNAPGQKQYDAPTLKRLNPELYKEMAKQQRQVHDPIFTSVQHMKERYSYHEMRVQRIQKRTEEVTKELEARREAEIAANKKKRGVSSQGSATR